MHGLSQFWASTKPGQLQIWASTWHRSRLCVGSCVTMSWPSTVAAKRHPRELARLSTRRQSLIKCVLGHLVPARANPRTVLLPISVPRRVEPQDRGLASVGTTTSIATATSRLSLPRNAMLVYTSSCSHIASASTNRPRSECLRARVARRDVGIDTTWCVQTRSRRPEKPELPKRDRLIRLRGKYLDNHREWGSSEGAHEL